MDVRKARVTLRDKSGAIAASGYVTAERIKGAALLKRKGIVYAVNKSQPYDVEATQTAYPVKITEF